MQKSLQLIFGIAMAISCSVASFAADQDEGRKIIEDNLKTLNDGDVEAHMATIHSESPNFEATRDGMKETLAEYKLKFTLISCTLVGKDGEYLVVRVKQKTEKITGPAFKNNEMDMMNILKKDKGKWKIWTSAVMESKFK